MIAEKVWPENAGKSFGKSSKNTDFKGDLFQEIASILMAKTNEFCHKNPL